jgi:diketogulonate reductase-like aldo/keto reductase
MPMPAWRFPDGAGVPRLGLGTWRMGERAAEQKDEVAALKLGLDLGMTLIDTAEMYGEGGAEKVVAEAIRGRRDEVFVVSKFYPYHAARAQLMRACEGSLARLGVEAIDLYLLHWRGSVPFAEMVETLERLVEDGKIRRWGVSNLDVPELEEIAALEGGAGLATDQVLYNLAHRGVEFDLVPWCAGRGVPVMAYSPLDQGDLAAAASLGAIAQRAGVSAAQLALAWVLRHPNVIAIPKAKRLEHVRANRAAADVLLDPALLEALDKIFAPPRRKRPLQMV